MNAKKPTFKEIIAYEKTILNPIRYHMNYRVIPVYAVFSIATIALSCIMMAIDDIYFLPHFIVLMVLFLLGSVALIIYGQAVVRKEIREEVERYDLKYEHIPDLDEYDYSSEDTRILFTQNGMHINDCFYWYNHLRVRILTEMYMHRVVIHIGFLTTQNELCEIPFDARGIKMLSQFLIQLENPHALDMLLHDTYNAFKTIYKKGEL